MAFCSRGTGPRWRPEPASGTPRREHSASRHRPSLSGSSNQVEYSLDPSVLVTGQIDHASQGPRTTFALADVMPDVLVDARAGDTVEPDGSSSRAAAGMRHTVRHVVPSCRTRVRDCVRPARSRPIAHQHARIINKPRGRQIRSSCSVNDLPEQLRGTARSVSATTPEPADRNTAHRPTPRAPATAGGDHPTLGNPLALAATPPSRSNDQRPRCDDLDDVQTGQADQQITAITIGSGARSSWRTT